MHSRNGFDWFIVALKRYVEFKGRSSRAEFWYFVLFLVIFSAVSEIIDGIFRTNIFNPIVSVVLFIPNISVAVRRLHDIDRSGWWWLFPIVNLIFFCQKGDASTNRFGPPVVPTMNFAQPASMAETNMDKLDMLERLADLRNKGVLSEEEFQAQKKSLL